MSKNVIGSIPEFTQDAPSVNDVGSQTAGESPAETGGATAPAQETATPTVPSAGNEPTGEGQPPAGEDSVVLETKKTILLGEIEGLKVAKKELILDLEDLRGQRREAKTGSTVQLNEADELKDLHPQDITTIERVLKAKGYVSKSSVNQMLYEARKQEEVSKFLDEFREYSEDNDPDKKKFGPLLKELSLYKEPEDPKLYGVLLRRAHKTLTGNQGSTDRGATATRQRQAEIAGVGAGGTQRSSSVKPFDAAKRQALKNGGWSDDDIKRMEQRQQ